MEAGLSTQAVIAVVIFVATYAFIVAEKVHRSVVALAGAAVAVFSGIITQDQAVAAIDFNTIGLLVGMMIIVGVTRETGVFEALAVYAARVARGEPVRILIYLSFITAFLSALLDNVTAVFLIVPVTFAVTRKLQVTPTPYLISEIIASNIGGTGTLIGDPPNIMISGPADLQFNDFLANTAPIAFVCFMAALAFLYLVYRRRLRTEPELKQQLLELRPRDYIRNVPLLVRSMTVLGLTIAGFLLHGVLHLPTASIALGGATLLLLITDLETEKAFHNVEWPTLFFFTGLFVLVGALEATGLMELAARAVLDVTEGRLLLTGLGILWVSALASGFVDNIPFVAAMIPLLQEMGRLGGIDDLRPLWWSLSLGACLGGNGTLVGAAANVIVAGLAERHGTRLTFARYFKVGFPVMLITIALSTVYLIIFHLRPL